MELYMNNKKKVLLLGDSIRISYQSSVADMLKDIAEVVGPEENCQFSAYTLASLDRWIEQLGKPDIVHWNNGIHDVGHNPDRQPIQYPLNEYISNLRGIITKLNKTGAKIIFATSTPVHPNRPFKNTEWAWRNDEIAGYNEGAVELMKSKCIPINDLHAVVAENYDVYLSEDMLHLSQEGIKKCAETVVNAIKPYLI
jgi:lysophospholipase L1-like esterase